MARVAQSESTQCGVLGLLVGRVLQQEGDEAVEARLQCDAVGVTRQRMNRSTYRRRGRTPA